MTAIRLHYTNRVNHPQASVEQGPWASAFTVRENHKIHNKYDAPRNVILKHPDGRVFFATKRTFALAKQYRQIRPFQYHGRFPVCAMALRVTRELLEDLTVKVRRYVGL